MKRFGIFGTSGFAREVADIALAVGYEPILIGRDQGSLAKLGAGYTGILESEVTALGDIEFSIGIGENELRKTIAERYADKLRFAALIHPTASFGYRQRKAIESAKGVIVCAGVRLTNNILVGDFSIFNLNVTVGHDSQIGAYVNVAPNASISGNVSIEASCWVGSGAVINQGTHNNPLRICQSSIIGSGSVVTRSCETTGVYVGIPAKQIK